MNTPKLSIVVALSDNRAIGNRDRLPWKRIPQDLQRLKSLTLHKVVILGRKTYASMEWYYSKTGRDFPGRLYIIITRDKKFVTSRKNCVVVYSIDEAFLEAKKHEENEVFITGGAQIFSEILDRTDKLYITLVKGNFEGDTYFPEYKTIFKKEILRQENEFEGQKFVFLELEK